MGEVYKAKDTRLDRTVALKVLPAHLSADPDLRRRFEREARAISSLSHPNICTLFDIGQQDDLEYIVMEYLEGQTLADRLMQGPLPLDEVYRYGIDIADALDKAHRQGIVHRDLKPGNIVLTRSGAKLLDFGLAKWMGEADQQLFGTPTDTTRRQPITTAGTLLGTVPYMAPEQLEGKPVDARTDIFAFGAILYEMATGVRAFNATSNASLIAALIHDDPVPASRIRDLPPRFDAIVQTCLKKNPNDRFQAAHDIKLSLQWLASGADDGALPAKAKSNSVWLVVAAGIFALVALAALLAAFARWPRAEEHKPSIRFAISPPAGSDFPSLGEGGGIALAPDGHALAFIAIGADGRSFLWLRALDSEEPKLLDGTEGAAYPLWSPDSRSLAFFAGGKLKRMLVPDGAPQTICDAAGGRGGTWSSDGVIVFAPGSSTGLWRVPAGGGQPVPITSVDNAKYSHRWPLFLPDGKHLLFLAQSAELAQQGIYAIALDDPKHMRRVVASPGSVAYAPPYLLYVRDGVLVRQRFDADKVELSGDPVSVADGMVYYIDRAYVPVTAAMNGVFAYHRHATLNMRIAWFDRRGLRLGTVWDPGEYEGLALSPDGTRLAFGHFDAEEGLNHIWMCGTADGVPRRFTFSKGNQYSPVWTPDGQRVVYSDDHSGVETLTEKLAGGGDEKPLLAAQADASQYALSWSPDGKTLLFRTDTPQTGLDIHAVQPPRAPFAYIATRADESQAQFSPDGRYVVYESSESGRQEVYVQPFPATGAKWQVSTSGGEQPRWSPGGTELFYVSADKKLMAVPLHRGATFDAGTPQPLFQTTMSVGYPGVSQSFDVTRDGQRFVIAATDPLTPPNPITVVVTR
jgi:eukaryotic-like serine/threonine-protein kinase